MDLLLPQTAILDKTRDEKIFFTEYINIPTFPRMRGSLFETSEDLSGSKGQTTYPPNTGGK